MSESTLADPEVSRANEQSNMETSAEVEKKGRKKKASAKVKSSRKSTTKKPARKKPTPNSAKEPKSSEELTAIDQEKEKQSAILNESNQHAGELNIKVSQNLGKKLRQQAADEGIGLEDFVVELLAESVVLRAFEIVERKQQMKSPQQASQQSSQQSQNYRNGNMRNNYGGRNKRNMNHGRYQNIMEDKASFLEYVRNQERNRR
ncbi:MAG: hypothetical protein CMP10_11255 [Zetaproteobacteria bacterium]|nr:hypothetical protein [Pseudobdellovibrionaceae bacterium]